MTDPAPEPYHPFRKRTPEGDDRDNLCAVCGRGPGDGVHHPTAENYPPMKEKPPAEAEGKE